MRFFVAQPLGYSIQTAEIDNKAVTYAKIQDISATDKVLGRETAAAGVVEEIACTAAGRALLDDASAAAQRTTLGLGDISVETAPLAVAKGGTALAALGAALRILRTNSGATAAEWAAIEAAIRDAITGTGSQVLRRNAGNTALEFAAAGSSDFVRMDYAEATTSSTTNVELTTKTFTADDFAIDDLMIIAVHGVHTGNNSIHAQVRVYDGTNTYTSSDIQVCYTDVGVALIFIRQSPETATKLCLSCIEIQENLIAAPRAPLTEIATMITNFISAAITVSIRGRVSLGTGWVQVYLYKLKAA